MREITLTDGKKFEVRGLKRKEIKELREYGYFISRYKPPENLEKADEGIEKVLDTVLGSGGLDDLENKETTELWFAIIKETYGAADEEKNSSTSGNGEQTKSE